MTSKFILLKVDTFKNRIRKRLHKKKKNNFLKCSLLKKILGGNQRDLARAKNQKKQQEIAKSKGAADKSGVRFFHIITSEIRFLKTKIFIKNLNTELLKNY